MARWQEGTVLQQLLEQGLELWWPWRKLSEEGEMEQRGRVTMSADHTGSNPAQVPAESGCPGSLGSRDGVTASGVQATKSWRECEQELPSYLPLSFLAIFQREKLC